MKHTCHFINQLQLIQKQLVDTVTGRRGFQSTSEKVFLERYYSGLEDITPIENELHILMKDDLNNNIEALFLKVKFLSL